MRQHYKQNNRCIICKKLITDYSKKCKSCNAKRPSKFKGCYWKFTKKQVVKLSKLYSKGYSLQELARKYNSNIKTIWQYFDRNKIKRRNHKEAGKIASKKIREALLKKKTKKQVYNAIITGEICTWKRWKTFRKKILEKDHYKCSICGKKATSIHHKKTRKKYPELCWRKSNVISICRSCHWSFTRTNVFTVYKQKIKNLENKVKKFKKMSYKNTLTDLWNARKLKEDIRRYRSLKKRFNIKFLVLLLDLDNFKKINDTFGHKEGDRILKKVAKVLKQNIRNYENAYRLSGDEFVMIISHYKNYETVKRRIKRSLSKINIEASIGVCEIDKPKCLEIADAEMYKEKHLP